MRTSSMRLLLLAAAFAAGPALAGGYKDGDRLAAGKAAAGSAYRQITWETLIPAGWDPAAVFKGMNLAKLKDSDPQAMDALRKMKEAWDTAPVEPKLNGERVRLPGFVVPLDPDLDHVKEFLLVPYFGACIHVPPPPANQVIHVFMKKPLTNAQIMGAVWVSGTLEVARTDTEYGAVGYSMRAEVVEPYKER